MKTIAICNQKGGVGKTCTALATAHGLAAKGEKVLFVDLDPQGSASYTLNTRNAQPTILDVMRDKADITETIRGTTGGLHTIPADRNARTWEDEIETDGLHYCLDSIYRLYDYAVIDTPPDLGRLSLSGLLAADYVLVPSQADFYSFLALKELAGTITAAKAENTRLKVAGILLTFYNPRTTLARELEDSLEDAAAEMRTSLFETRIRRGQAAADAAALQQSIYTYAPRAGITNDYSQFVEELLERVN